MDSGPLVIDIDAFLSIQAKDDPRLNAIASGLLAQYACFKDDTRKLYQQHHHSHKKHNSAEKPRIGTRELSREALARKEFLAMINKISPQNIEAMRTQCKTSLRPDFVSMYVDMLWDAMLRSSPDYHVLFTSILHTIDSVQSVFGDIHRTWNAYVASKPWIPDSVDKDGDTTYDDFCDKVKAKKRFISSVCAWVHLSHGKLCDPAIPSQLLHLLMDQEPTDVILEGLIELYKGVPDIFQTQVVDTLQKLHQNAQSYPPIIRFKIYDMWDLLCKK